ncbi:MAG TPA: hypothetical protein VGM06_16740 [Polyangiaceae bacterium]
MEDGSRRSSSSNLRGWLSEVYLPALLSSQCEDLSRRLGSRATVDDPIFGRASGTAAVREQIDQAAAWFAAKGAGFERVAFTTGSDRDVTEGVLTFVVDGKRVVLPVAVVAERRPEREVEIRVYHSTKSLGVGATTRSPLVPRDDELPLPPPIDAHLYALARGDIESVIAGFEEGATLRDPLGGAHPKAGEGGALRAYYERLIGTGIPRGPGLDLLKGARADDGRTCALEYTVAKLHGRDVPPQPGLAVYERGESGLLRAARLYHDLET